MPGRSCPVDGVEPLVFIDVDNVVVRVAVKARLGTDVEKLVAVKEIEIEETAQKFFARLIVCVSWSGQRDETHSITNVW